MSRTAPRALIDAVDFCEPNHRLATPPHLALLSRDRSRTMDAIEFDETGRVNRATLRARLRALSDMRRRQRRDGTVALGPT